MLSYRANIRLRQYTTLFVGGVADYVVEATTEAEVEQAVRLAESAGQPLLVLGGGSNVLLDDAGWRGMVIVMKQTGVTYEEQGDTVLVTAEAGVVLDALIAEVTERGYWGLENLSAIPGSVGATPVQNVGAYGVEVADCITYVTALHKKSFIKKIFSRDDCLFSYRDSFFKTDEGREWIILSVTFRLQKNYTPTLTYGDLQSLQSREQLTPRMVRDAVIAIRAQKFPNCKKVGTAGSFFKNPIITNEQYTQLKQQYSELPGYLQADGMVKVSLGWILDKVCNLRGYTEGNVGLYEAQALVLVNNRTATAAEIDVFAKKISEIVFSKTNIHIEREVCFIKNKK